MPRKIDLTKVPKVIGRPEKPIDWELVDRLLICGCTATEIAAHFDMGYDRFCDRLKDKYGLSFTLYSTEKRQKGISLLKAKQFDKALKGDNTMLVWVGKNFAGQRDTPVDITLSTETLTQFDALMNQLETAQVARKISRKSDNVDRRS